MALLVKKSKMRIGEIHTYIELFLQGPSYLSWSWANLPTETVIFYTGPNTEVTRLPTRFKQGIVAVAQVEKIVETSACRYSGGLDRLHHSDRNPLLHRAALHDRPYFADVNILIAMMVIKGHLRKVQEFSLIESRR